MHHDLYQIVHLWSFNVWDEYVDHILITEKHKLPKRKSSTLFLDMILFLDLITGYNEWFKTQF